MTQLRVTSGHILVLRLFDVAYAIDLARAQALWTQRATGSSARLRLSATRPKAMAFGVPPLVLALEPVTLDVAGVPVPATVTARLYSFGVVTLALHVPAMDLTWDAYTDLVNAVDAAIGPEAGTTLWEKILADLRAVVDDAFDRPERGGPSEDYLIGVVHGFDAPMTATAILTQLDLVRLLAGETRALSEATRTELLRSRFSYYEDDLVVLTWDRAFIYEPRGESDVDDVLEVANAQLLEMRYYDEKLDAELPRMYEQVERASRGLNVLAARRYAGLARQLYTMVAEVTELTEQVDNALQVTEDVYLARVYAAALELFRVRLVTAAVNRKLAIIRDTYSALYDKAAGSRSTLMEAAILVLIAVELVLALMRR
jgi:hypothetical protein